MVTYNGDHRKLLQRFTWIFNNKRTEIIHYHFFEINCCASFFLKKLLHMLYLLERKLSYLPPYWTLHVSELLYPKLLMFLEKTFILLLGDTFLHWKHEKTHHKLTVLIDFHQSGRRQNQHIKISSFLYTKTKLAHKIRKKQK